MTSCEDDDRLASAQPMGIARHTVAVLPRTLHQISLRVVQPQGLWRGSNCIRRTNVTVAECQFPAFVKSKVCFGKAPPDYQMCSCVAPDNGIRSETPAYLLYVCHSAVAGVGKYRLKIYRFVFRDLVYFAFVLFSRTF